MPRRKWEIPEREATDEAVYLNRRRFLRGAGLGTIGLISGCIPDRLLQPKDLLDPQPFRNPSSAPRTASRFRRTSGIRRR